MGFDLTSIGKLLAGDGVSAIAKRLKLKTGDVAKVLSAGIPTLLGGMQRNTGTKDGESSLSRAAADHGAADLTNVGAFLKSADLKDGKKILGHVLGGDQKAVTGEIAKASGVSAGKVTSVLALVAPLLLSLLGSQQNQNSGLSIGSLLGGLLGGQSGGSLLGGLFGGGQSSSAQSQDNGLLTLLGGSQTQSSSQNEGGGLLNSLLNLFH